MRKFLSKVLSYFLIILVLIILINHIYVSSDAFERNNIRDNTMKFRFIPESIDICNFGSSHGLYGFCYEDFEEEYTCFNFGLASQSLSYDYRLLQNYSDKIDEGAVVFITISYFSFFGEGEEKEEEFASKNKRYYKILPKSLIKNYEFVTDLCTNLLPVLDQYENLLFILQKSGDDAAFERIWEDQNQTADQTGELQIEARDRAMAHVEVGKRDKNGKRIINNQEVDALYDMIDFCKRKGFFPILITTPYLSEYTNAVVQNSSDFYSCFYKIIDKVVKDTGVCYYDYGRDERFKSSYNLFSDGDHLNHKGAVKFVDILFDEVINK